MPYGNNIPLVIKERREWWQEHAAYLPVLSASDRERVEYRYWLNHDTPTTADEAGQHFGISGGRISEVIKIARFWVRRWEQLTLESLAWNAHIARWPLKDAGIRTMADLTHCTPKQLLDLVGFAPSDLPRIQALMAAHGWELQPDE